jgi:hypothetical protein
LVAQDDATHAAWWRDDAVTPLRLFPPVAGHDLFSDEHGTKRLKPDLEAACAVDLGGTPSTLLLGSGSLPNRTRAALVSDGPDRPRVTTADLTPHYDLVGRALGVSETRRNLEGACVVGDHLRWFQRGDRRRCGAALDAAAADTSGAVPKVEGLAVLTASADMLELLAVVDADEPSLASPVLHLTVSGFA